MPLNSDDYPYYSVTATADGQLGSNPAEEVFSFSFQVTDPETTNDLYPGITESFFAAVKSWAEGYGWASPTGGNTGEIYSLGSFSITEYSQQTTDVTPA